MGFGGVWTVQVGLMGCWRKEGLFCWCQRTGVEDQERDIQESGGVGEHSAELASAWEGVSGCAGQSVGLC